MRLFSSLPSYRIPNLFATLCVPDIQAPSQQDEKERFLFEFFLFYLLLVSFISPHFTHLVFAQLIQSLVLTLSTHTTRPMTKKNDDESNQSVGEFVSV